MSMHRNRKLVLNRETLRELSGVDLKRVAGAAIKPCIDDGPCKGDSNTCNVQCDTSRCGGGSGNCATAEGEGTCPWTQCTDTGPTFCDITCAATSCEAMGCP